MANEEVMRTEGLRKRYGSIEAVGGLDIHLNAGEVYSFLGPNGSGKSTTVGMILGLVRPTAGRALVFGNDMATHAWPTLKRIGAMIEAPAFYPYLSGYDNLKVITKALGDIPDTRIEEVLELVGLVERAHSQYKTYSLGMKQRLGIASTLVRDPDIVILDEPTNGLDPAGTREVRELIPTLARQGRAVFLCSHLLREVQEVSDRVAIVQRGKLVTEGRVDDLLGRGQFLRLKANNMDALARELSNIDFVADVNRIDGFFKARAPVENAARLNEMLAAKGVVLSELTPWQVELEEIFLELTGSETQL